MIRRHCLLISLTISLFLISSLFPKVSAARKHLKDNLDGKGEATQAKAKRVALVIGNNKYSQAALINPCNDAEDMRVILTSFGFDVEPCFDASLAKAQEAIDRFIKKLEPNSVGLFYYAGHGMQIEEDNYLIPVDFVDKDAPTAKRTSYSLSLLSERMSNANRGLNIIILDACRDNPFKLSKVRGIKEGLTGMFLGTGTFIAFATGPNNVADDNPYERNGLFTKHLLASLKEPPVCLSDVFERTREKVAEESNKRIQKLIKEDPVAGKKKKVQIPWVTTSVLGKFCFKEEPPTDKGIKISVNPPPPPPITPNNECKGIIPSNPESLLIDGNYEPSGIMGDIEDVRIKKLEDSTQFRYAPTGKGRHEWDYKYDRKELSDRPAEFGGVMYLHPPNNFGNVCGGIDLSAVRRVIKWEARSSEPTGEVRVEFIIGGVSWTWDEETKEKITPRFPDSMPRKSLGTRKLTPKWQSFEYNLSDLPASYFTRVINGFTWVINWGSNDVNLKGDNSGPGKPKIFEIELRNIRYER